MKQVTTDTKRSSSETPAKATDAPETAATGDSTGPDSPVRLPGKLEHWNIDRLRPYERNPRTHSPEQITKIAASLLEFGWTNPILVDGDAGIIAGHGRLLAARELGMTTVPVIELTHLTEAQKRAYVIADNRLALDAGWDEDLLADELRALEGLDFNLELTGFDLDELHDLLDDESAEEVPAPEPPDDPVSQQGDLWVLGNHRLLCGDSSDPASLDRLLGGAVIHLVNTDPPYNVKVEPRSNNAIAAGLSSFPAAKSAVEASDAHGMHHQGFDLARHKTKAKATGKMRPKDRPLANDFVSDEAFDEMLLAWFGNIARVLQPGRCFYIWGGYANCANYPPVLKACGLYFSQAVIWVKEHPVLTRKDFMGNHEWAFYGWREGAGHKFYGPDQRRGRLGGQEGQPAEHGPPDREADRAGRARDPVLIEARRERARPVRRQRVHPDGRRTDGPACLPHGTRSRLHRRDRDALAGSHRTEGHARRGRTHVRRGRR